MERVALHTRLRPGKESEYDRVHAAIPRELEDLLRRNGVVTWQIFRRGLDLFHYVEVESYAALLRAVENDPINVAWQKRMAELLDIVHDYASADANTLPLVWELPKR